MFMPYSVVTVVLQNPTMPKPEVFNDVRERRTGKIWPKREDEKKGKVVPLDAMKAPQILTPCTKWR